MCEEERNFYIYAMAMTIAAFVLWFLVGCFGVPMYTIGFVVFGIPIIYMATSFWKSIIEVLFISK